MPPEGVAPPPPPEPDDSALSPVGHRERLRDRFLSGGADAMPDYELLELLLALAIPRRDVKPLAKDLIRRFGSFAGVIAAEPTILERVPGIGRTTLAALKLVQAGAARLARQEALDRPVLTSWATLIRHLRVAMAHERVEQFRLLFLDRTNTLIADEVQQVGTINHTAVYPREVVKRALELGATAVILAHNHPSGDPTPSKGDIEMTRALVAALKAIDVVVHDHVIVGRKGETSFREAGLL